MWTFEKHMRQNAANIAAKRDGGRVTYDYRVLRDGEHVAWFKRDGAKYYLADLFHEAIRRDRTELDRATVPPVYAFSQDRFAEVVTKNAHKIPTVAELNARKAEREERIRRANEDERRDREQRPELYR